MISPIAIFAYKRLDTLTRAIDALKANRLAGESDLYLFSDAPRSEKDGEAVNGVRQFCRGITGFKNIHFEFAQQNKGLATSIIEGVDKILEKEETVIVLEDDLVTSPNFLQFMNQGLEYYRNNEAVLSISGYTVPIKKPKDFSHDNYFTLRATSWGWATWRDRWSAVDWEVSDYPSFAKDGKAGKRLNRMGSDMAGMLAKQMRGELDSWAIRWCYHQFKHNLFTVFPMVSKIKNVGFGAGATNTKERFNRYATPLDTGIRDTFAFDPAPKLNPYFIKQFTSKYSIRTRIYYKVLNTIFR